MKKTFSIQISGLVQGVGFRPFIYHLAGRYSLTGTVENNTEGVRIFVTGEPARIHRFCDAVRSEAPPASNIESLVVSESQERIWKDFTIISSSVESDLVTEVSPDIAVCDECLQDMETQTHRVHYPFINCTHCGPRFTIVRDLPYDRSRTSMNVFPMCDQCNSEYRDVDDRRFHAQPVACLNCGPRYELRYGRKALTGTDEIIYRLARLIEAGKIVALKGLGGFHLACNAEDESAVQRLRKIKSREGKPFAVMYASYKELVKATKVSPEEKQSLLSWRRPIVLLRNRQDSSWENGVNRGLHTTGAMLPYMPFHHLLFRELNVPAIVLTSGNLADEPIITDNREAEKKLRPKTDGLLLYNRDIENRTDDSVVRIIYGKERVFRRSRGYAPSPVRLHQDAEGILATGAELNNCFCIGKGNMAILSQHIGDMKNPETFEFFTETVRKFQRLFRFKPSLVTCDMHPDYYTTGFAREFSVSAHIPLMQIQHHHAHIASCMAEHQLDEKVIGVAMDGTGYGDDGHIWGAEFLCCDLCNYERFSHFEYVPLPGGDRATEEPWRMGISYLYKVFGGDYRMLDLPFVKKLDKKKAAVIETMIRSGINSPQVSSAGRLFDAVAAIADVCTFATFQAEAPMRLESLAGSKKTEAYHFNLGGTISFDPAIRDIVADIKRGRSAELISARFHHTVISAIFETVKKMSEKYGLDKVVLSGGTFQNRYLVENTAGRLSRDGFKVYLNEKIPPNDGGLALGQLSIAAKRRMTGCA